MKRVERSFAAFGVLMFMIATLWLFDFSLSLMNKKSDLWLVVGIALVFVLCLAWVYAGRKLYLEGKLFYEALEKKYRPKKEETKKEG